MQLFLFAVSWVFGIVLVLLIMYIVINWKSEKRLLTLTQRLARENEMLGTQLQRYYNMQMLKIDAENRLELVQKRCDEYFEKINYLEKQRDEYEKIILDHGWELGISN